MIILLSAIILFFLRFIKPFGEIQVEKEDNSKKEFISPLVVSIFYHRWSENSSVLSIKRIQSIKYEFQAFKQNFTIILHQHSLGPKVETLSLQTQCHFTGFINKNEDSGAHFNLCNGMIGVFYLDAKEYFIEATDISKNYPGFTNPGSILLPHIIYYNKVVTKSPIFSCKLLNQINVPQNIPKKTHFTQKRLQRIKRNIEDDKVEGSIPFVDHEIINEHIIELLVVVTSNIVKRLKSTLNEYILNNVAIATKMLRHPSIKNSIAINVVDIISLDREYERLNDLDNWSLLAQDAVVDRFCHWVRYWKKHAKYTWDSAVIINDGSFSTYAIGITHLRSMCAVNSCVAVVDRGFGTGLILAHEIGHQMNARHDFDGATKCNTHEDNGQEQIYNTIMSTSLYFEHYPFIWSQCSERLINSYLRSEDSWCLKEQNKVSVLYSHEHIYDHHNNFSMGLRYDLNTQCSLAFGEPAEHCNTKEHIKSCSSLYCNPKRMGVCMRSQSIVGDGTPCEKGKRCIHGECIEINTKVESIDGGWSDFTEWSNCSRKCNGGVQFSERLCNNPIPTVGGRYCVGTKVQIRSCNTHDCEHEVDIREEICRKFEAKPYVPRVDEEAVCRLICIKDNKVVRHGISLPDGTPCYAHRTDVCVSSKCYKTGCDRVLSSTKVYDNCRICGGKNDSCTRVDKYFDGSKISSSRGMLVAFKFPINISNIYVKKISERYYPYSDEVYDDYQILLLIDHNTMIRRGESIEPFRGGELYYSGSNKKEEIYRISGFIQKEIVVLIRTENPATILKIPSVEYHYYVPNRVSSLSNLQDLHSWKYLKINESQCNGLCKAKIEISSACFRSRNNIEVSDIYCKNKKRLEKKFKDCRSTCGYQWSKPSENYIRIAAKDSCPIRCGAGNMIIDYQCQKKFIDKRYKSNWKMVSENYCFSVGLSERPYKIVHCVGECYPLTWSYDSWENCSTGCGSGFRYRTVTCKDTKGRSWNNEQCLKEFGEAEEKEACTSFATCKNDTYWSKGSWSVCSKKCGSGTQSRPVFCLRKLYLQNLLSNKISLKGEQVLDVFCLSHSEKPNISRICQIEPCYSWILSTGGQCSVSCGVGFRTNNYICMKSGEFNVTVNDNHCFQSGIEKPKSNAKPCKMNTCVQPKWITLPWGKCSESCGKGVKFRLIRCGYNTTNNRTLWLRNDASCRNETRPTVMEYCQDVPCSSWRYGLWSQCQGICLYGIQHRTSECIDEDSKKILSNSLCDLQTQSPIAKRCLLSALCGYWKIGEWSKCSVTCGLGTRTRSVDCYHANGTRSSDTSICQTSIPLDEIHCENPVCKSKPFWWLLKSSECYAYGCNSGVLYSDIRCVDEGFQILSDSLCNDLKHPNYYTGCIKKECRQYSWKAESWSNIPCSSNSCMMTIRNRKVTCADDYGNLYGNEHCDESSKPDDWRLCSSPRNCSDVPRSCKELKMRHPDSKDGEYSLAIDLNWTYFIYCADMNTENPTEYVTLKRPNYSRSSKILFMRTNETCIYSEEYEDHHTCSDCKSDDTLQSTTYYNKIRVNMTDLSIDIYDNRYSTTIGSDYLPYGTAKDCSGSKSCPQGRFVVDLSGTEFSVSIKTVWHELYHNYGYRIIRTKGSQVVKGWCGGKCSGCSPLPKLYIEPQMYGRDLEVKGHI